MATAGSPAPGRAWVTGASSGIGAAFARALARSGYQTVLVARRRERLLALADELGGAELRVADLADAAQLEELARELEADDRATLLVNSAGLLGFGPFEQRPWELERAQIDVMVAALTRLTRAALVGMKPRGRGAIVQISSIAGLRPHARMATYCGAKAFVNTFTLALAAELEGSGVRLVAVCPGATRTEIFDRAGLEPPAGGRWMEPEAVVQAALAALARGETLCLPGEGRRERFLRALVPRRLRPKLHALAGRILRP